MKAFSHIILYRQYDTKIPFTFQKVCNKHRHPLSHYLFDEDVTGLLKRSYSTAKKEDIAADDDVMESYFGSMAHGREVLENISEDKWNIV